MQILLMDTNRKMPTFPRKVRGSSCHAFNSSLIKILTSYRSTSKNHTRFLADGLGSTMLSDCDDDKNNGARTREMSSILGIKGG